MAFNYIWVSFFVIAFVVAIFKFLVDGDVAIFGNMVQSTFSSAETSVNISIYLIGVITLWQGIMKVGEDGGAVRVLTRLVSPFFSRLFPGVPKDHPAFGSMMMNFSANMLGLDNAATPLGLKAMQGLQEVNQDKESASNAMIMFIVLNTSGLTIVPISVMALRGANGAANPSDVFLPILLATYFATLAGLLFVCIRQRINLFQPVLVGWIGGITALIGLLIYWFGSLPKDQLADVSSVFGNGIILTIIVTFILMAVRKKINVYESFIEGAKEGFGVSIKIIPYLVAILVAIGLFRTSGAMDYILEFLATVLHLPKELVDALPTAFMKPLSGSGARGMMVEAMNTYGADSFTGRLASVFQGSTETTFYTLAVYFGSVSIRKTRYALGAGLFADLFGILAAIAIGYVFFG
ncbi:MAG: spore maturation protein [Flavobacteriales bacterium]|jgi:spore maturation protein SpmA|nr:spore maturation protein [Flavobacteriales bacterium]